MNLIYVLLGILGWIVLHFANSKNVYDKQGKNFNVKKYFAQNYDDMLFALVGGYIVYFAFPFLWQAYFYWKKVEAPALWDAYAALCGFFGGLVLQQIYRLINKFSAK